jgi:hypothetical protein
MATRLRLLSLLCLFVCMLSSCAPVSLGDSWRCPGEAGKRKYSTILVASMLSQYKDRQKCEENIAFRLQRRGIVTYTGCELFPGAGRPTWQFLAEAVKASGADCVLTIQAIPSRMAAGEESNQWIGRVSLYPDDWLPEMFPKWNLYSHFGYTSFYEPTLNDSNHLFVQVNLFDVESRQLIWAGKIETNIYGSLPTGSGEVAKLLIESLAQADLI